MQCWKKYFYEKKRIKERKKQLENKYWLKFRIYKCKECKGFHLTTQNSVESKEYFRINK